MSQSLPNQLESLRRKVLESKENLLKQVLSLKRNSVRNISKSTLKPTLTNYDGEKKRKFSDKDSPNLSFVENFNKKMKGMNSNVFSSNVRNSSISHDNETASIGSTEDMENMMIDDSDICESIMDSENDNDRNKNKNNEYDHDLSVKNQEDSLSIEKNPIHSISSKLLNAKELLLKKILLRRRRTGGKGVESIGKENQSILWSDTSHLFQVNGKWTHSTRSKKMKPLSQHLSSTKVATTISSFSLDSDLSHSQIIESDKVVEISDPMSSSSSTTTTTISPLHRVEPEISVDDKMEMLRCRLMESKERTLKNLIMLKQRKIEKISCKKKESSIKLSAKNHVIKTIRQWAQNQTKNRFSINKKNIPFKNKAYVRIKHPVIIKKHRSKQKDREIIKTLLEIFRKQSQSQRNSMITKSRVERMNKSKKGIIVNLLKKRVVSPCLFFMRFGKCRDNETCPYIHDKKMVHICTNFLNGSCSLHDEDCLLCHEIDPVRLPDCKFYTQGSCKNESCRYRHKEGIHQTAAFCTAFRKGGCLKGIDCPKRHEYSENIHKSEVKMESKDDSNQSHDLNDLKSVKSCISGKLDLSSDETINNMVPVDSVQPSIEGDTLEKMMMMMKKDDKKEEEDDDDDGCDWILDLSGDQALYLPLPLDDFDMLNTTANSTNNNTKRYFG